ncbi:type II secretion system F family protein [Actinomadura viridis]|uniref:type II secretion system F family protein n=1 Tax=Actinomadura viridis TaxID=58110 RepID=UPI00368ED6F9
MPLLIALAAGLTVPLFVWGYHLRSHGRPAAADAQIAAGKARKKKEHFGPFGEIINPLGRPLAPLVLRTISPSARGKLRQRIERAGRPAGLTVEGYAQNKAGNITVYGVAGLSGMISGHPYLGLLLLAIGFVQTDIVLWNLTRERQEEIQRGLPDFLDVLTVTVSAGMGFRPALRRVAESMPGALSDEMMTALRQMELGAPFRTAFEDLRQRNDSDSLAGFITAILQAEELGAPLARALSEISVDMRRDAFQHARRRAQRADPQITMVVTFLMVPGMILLIIAMLYWGSGANVSEIFGG